MKQLAIERLQTSVPSFAENLGAIAINIDQARSISIGIAETRERAANLERSYRDHSGQTEQLFRDLVKDVAAADELSVIEKAALLAAIRNFNSYQLSRGSMPAESFCSELQSDNRMMLASLRATQRITRRPGQPVLYFEILGGESYFGEYGDRIGHVERPCVSKFFSAQTEGNGLEINADFEDTFSGGSVEFGITDCAPDQAENFIGGYQFNQDGATRLSMRKVALLVGTPSHARKLLKRSLRDLQTNPVFVGEKACDAAREFLKQNVSEGLDQLPVKN